MTSLGTWWLYSGHVLPAAVILWIVVRDRVTKRGARARTWSEARQVERERIARELHDTLLPAFQSVLLRLDRWGRDPGLPEESRTQIKEVAHTTRAIVVEGRDKIFELRNHAKHRQCLADLIRAVGEVETALARMTFHFQLTGREQAIPADVANDIFDIVREAIRNAVAHSECDAVAVRMSFRKQLLTVAVEDDGCGIHAGTVTNPPGHAHFGILGMHERALALDASLTIARRAGRGTAVVLRVSIRK